MPSTPESACCSRPPTRPLTLWVERPDRQRTRALDGRGRSSSRCSSSAAVLRRRRIVLRVRPPSAAAMVARAKEPRSDAHGPSSPGRGGVDGPRRRGALSARRAASSGRTRSARSPRASCGCSSGASRSSRRSGRSASTSAPLIAGAGVLGVAIGFGAQGIVKDFLSGVIMLVEDQYGVGDVIDAGVASGVVEEVSLRTTRLRDVNGDVWHIPNGSIARVGNMTQEWSRMLVDVDVAYETDIDHAIELLADVARALRGAGGRPRALLGEPMEIWGVHALGDSGVAIRVVAKTRAGPAVGARPALPSGRQARARPPGSRSRTRSGPCGTAGSGGDDAAAATGCRRTESGAPARAARPGGPPGCPAADGATPRIDGLLPGVVARAHERAGLDVREAELLLAVAAQLGEHLRGHVAVEREVLRRRLQVLADGERVDPGGRRSRMHSRSSSSVSPIPAMRFDFTAVVRGKRDRASARNSRPRS
jgi:hypothetical protein